MKYKYIRRSDRLTKWHRWFAWHPVRIGKKDCRWLEYIKRKGTTVVGPVNPMGSIRWLWQYRV